MATTFAYVASQGGATGIEVINVTTATQLSTINAGTTYNYICISPDGKTLYATRTSASLVDAIDIASATTITSIPSHPSPLGICITPDGAKVYVAAQSPLGDGITVIATATNTVVATITTGIVDVSFVSVSPDGARVYASEAAAGPNGHVRVITTASDTVVGSITLGAFVGTNTNVAVSSNNKVGYVGYAGTQVVSVLNLITLTLTATFSVSNTPDGNVEVISTDGLTLYTGGLGNLLSIDSTASNTETSTLPGTGANEGLALTPDGKILVATNAASAVVYLIDTTTNTIANTVSTTGTGLGVCCTPSSGVPLVVGNLFIPRKGFNTPYTADDFYADWRTIENWANTAWNPSPPNLFIPCKPSGRPPTVAELDTNWHAIEDWANAIGVL